MKENGKKAIAAALGGNMIWGFSYLLTRIGQQYALPAQVLAIRFAIAFVLLNIMMLCGWEKLRLTGKKLRPLIFLCVTELCCFFFESYGIYYTNATIAGVFMAASPIAAILLAAVFLREYPTRGQALFCLLPVIGVAMISMAGESLGVVAPIGALCLVLFCFSSGAYKTANRAASMFTPFERTYVLIGACTVAFSTLTAVQLRGDLRAYLAPFVHWEFTAAVLTLGVFCSIAANMLVNYASGRISVTKMANFGAVTTVCSTVSGILFLHEPMSWMIALGAVLILLGVWQVNQRGK